MVTYTLKIKTYLHTYGDIVIGNMCTGLD